eukprot:Unigene6853_Nuclearia_a/m.20995 Unigene6853_Nuclearia_a/g.20995  ORF Unigene6853_Nuclearia_a/g.20995 Unigene6853_Nuclearia_a/m.20995 type:complete len:199 (-) Unigene6853_Nuclearia_a:109-705(-)
MSSAASTGAADAPSTAASVVARGNALMARYQKTLDDMTPHVLPRWAAFAGTALLYFVRVYFVGGFYIVTYALGIYLLNLLIAFLSPSIDPSLELDMDEGEGEGPSLPTKSDEEFRPFIRRLPEFKFWLQSMQAFVVATVCTFFPFLDVPVFWPILLVYFFILFAVTMRKQIRHMIKYRYIPFSFGKKVYKGKAPASSK